MMPHTSGHAALAGPSMQDCLDNCSDCHKVCVETVQYCLAQGGKHAEPEHLRLLLDCADMCATSADFLARESDLHGRVCGVCAEVCEKCAESCEEFGDDEQMQKCAEACRKSAESCRRMAAH